MCLDTAVRNAVIVWINLFESNETEMGAEKGRFREMAATFLSTDQAPNQAEVPKRERGTCT